LLGYVHYHQMWKIILCDPEFDFNMGFSGGWVVQSDFTPKPT